MRYRSAPGRISSCDVDIVRQFLDASVVAQSRYEVLFRYILEGFVVAATPGFERAHYRGMGSWHGHAISGVEGFARTAPLFAAWLGGGRSPIVEGLMRRRPVDLREILTSAIECGADPRHKAYWGRVGNRSQLIVEAADIALMLWLGRETIWPLLDATSRSNLVTWLRQAASAEPYPNNWLLFGVTIDAALAALDGRSLRASARYERFKRCYLGHGWFSDAEDRHVVDYYNVWGITYPLFWLHRMQPAFDAEFLRGVVLQSADLTAHLISPKGIPIMGRSICYRAAVPAPLVLATLIDDSPEQLGRARRALDCVWRYLVENGALRDGTLTQGYFADDARVFDNYSGPGSSHWGLRSLVPAVLHASASAFWTVPEHPLPVEQGDYRLDLDELGWRVEGDASSGDIRIIIAANAGQEPALKPYTVMDRLREAAFQRAMRPDNSRAAYGAEIYSALDPFPLRAR